MDDWKVITLAEIANRPKRESLWFVDEFGDISVRDMDYWVPINWIKSPMDILRLVDSLCGKSWVTVDHIEDFVLCACKAKRLEMWPTDLKNSFKAEHVRPQREIAKRLRYSILRRDYFKCVLCGRSAQDGVVLHVDHIIPVSSGGVSEPYNLRTLCGDCNLGKGTL